MSENLKIILGEFEKYKGQFVITDLWRVERLVAIGDDTFDWYYITFDGRDFHWYSCVGRIIPLKGYIDDKHYDNLIRIAKLNHYDQIDYDKFLISVDEWISKYPKENKFIAGPYWELI